jgi:hypothetical protein
MDTDSAGANCPTFHEPIGNAYEPSTHMRKSFVMPVRGSNAGPKLEVKSSHELRLIRVHPCSSVVSILSLESDRDSHSSPFTTKNLVPPPPVG